MRKHTKRNTTISPEIPMEPILRRAEVLLAVKGSNGEYLRHLLKMASEQAAFSDNLTDAQLIERNAIDLAAFTMLYSLLTATMPKEFLKSIIK